MAVELYRTPQGWSMGGERAYLAEFYPRLLSWLISRRPAHFAEVASPDVTLETISAPGTLLEVRRWVALLSTLAVPLTYLLARRFVRAPAALFAAALLATSLLAVLFAHQARPHAVTTTTTLLALLACLHAAARPSRTAWLAAGAACGVAIGILHNGLALLPSLAVAAWLSGPGPRGAARNLGLAALTLVPLVLLSYPAYLRGSEPRLADDGARLDLSGHEVLLGSFDGGGWRILWRTLAGFEPALGIAAAGAVLAWLALPWRSALRERRALLVVLAFALPYLLVLVLYRHTHERFYSPLLPLLAVAAAWGLERLAERPRGFGGARLASGLGALILLPGLASCARLDLLFLRPHSTTRMAEWIAAHLPPEDTRIAIPASLDLPPPGTAADGTPPACPPAPYPARLRMHFASPAEIEAYARDPLPKLREWSASHYVRLEPARPLPGGPAHAMNQWLESHARCLVVLPERSIGVVGGGPSDYQDSDPDHQALYLLRLWRGQALGPRLGLWAVREDARLTDDLAPAQAAAGPAAEVLAPTSPGR